MTEDKTYLVTEMLNAVDAFMSGEEITPDQKALCVMTIGASFRAIETYAECLPFEYSGDPAWVYVFTQTFLKSLSKDLADYYHGDAFTHKARNEARKQRDQRLEAISPSKPDEGKTP